MFTTDSDAVHGTSDARNARIGLSGEVRCGGTREGTRDGMDMGKGRLGPPHGIGEKEAKPELFLKFIYFDFI